MKPVYLIIVSVLLLILGAFYWFQLRPARIRIYCHNNAEENAKVWVTSNQDDNTSEIYDRSFIKCLNEHGLK